MTRIIFSLLLSLLITPSFGQIDGDNLFDDSYLHEIRLEMVDTNVYITTKDYQQVNIQVDGVALDSVGIKRKGNISGYPETNKFGIKVKTNKYVSGKEYDGTKEWTLHMNFQDPSMMREKLTYDLCDDLGLFSLRTAFAKVYINDIYWGLFTLVEGKDEMYKQVFGDRGLDAVESLDFGNMCYISDNPMDYWNGDFPNYQLDNGDAETAWPRFAQMIDIANNTSDADYIEAVSAQLNLEDFLVYQALNVYLMNFDSYIGFRGNQIYLYDTTANLWQVTPWDFNASFGLWNTNNFSPNQYPLIPNTIANGCIADRIETLPALRDIYLNAMCDLIHIVGDTTDYFSRIDELKEQIQQAVYDDTRKVISNPDFDRGIGYGYHELFFDNQPALKTFLTDRLAVISAGLMDETYSCMPTSIHQPNSVEISIYPNPSRQYIYLPDDLVCDACEYKIVDLSGRALQHGILDSNPLDLSELPNGLYILKLKKDQITYLGKIIKQ